MKRLIIICIISAAFMLSCKESGTPYANPLDVKFGDPYVLLASDGPPSVC